MTVGYKKLMDESGWGSRVAWINVTGEGNVADGMGGVVEAQFGV